ncbi:MAG: DUF6316 family protein [Alcanivorax sp.]|nr:DUF6316 family protein [Alcanivorax sp.]
MGKRTGDPQNKTFFRSDRFFCEGTNWYFCTREGTTEGPFESKEDAQQELFLYLRRINERERFGIVATTK